MKWSTISSARGDPLRCWTSSSTRVSTASPSKSAGAARRRTPDGRRTAAAPRVARATPRAPDQGVRSAVRRSAARRPGSWSDGSRVSQATTPSAGALRATTRGAVTCHSPPVPGRPRRARGQAVEQPAAADQPARSAARGRSDHHEDVARSGSFITACARDRGSTRVPPLSGPDGCRGRKPISGTRGGGPCTTSASERSPCAHDGSATTNVEARSGRGSRRSSQPLEVRSHDLGDPGVRRGAAVAVRHGHPHRRRSGAAGSASATATSRFGFCGPDTSAGHGATRSGSPTSSRGAAARLPGPRTSSRWSTCASVPPAPPRSRCCIAWVRIWPSLSCPGSDGETLTVAAACTARSALFGPFATRPPTGVGTLPPSVVARRGGSRP